MNAQIDEGSLESIAELIRQASYPEYAIISIGATRYTEFGKQTFLQPGDESLVVVYDASIYTSETIEQRLKDRVYEGPGISVLSQYVVM